MNWEPNTLSLVQGPSTPTGRDVGGIRGPAWGVGASGGQQGCRGNGGWQVDWEPDHIGP